MRTVEIGPEALGRGSLILVTPEHPLTSEPKPEELVLAAAGNSEIQMNQTAAALFGHLLRRVQSGNRILAASGYRTFEEQKRIWEETLEKDGLEFTKKYVAKPGHSEHQTGLAVDLAENQGEIRSRLAFDGPDDLYCQRGAALYRAAVFVGSMVIIRRKKLRHFMRMRAMDLRAVKPDLARSPGAGRVA